MLLNFQHFMVKCNLTLSFLACSSVSTFVQPARECESVSLLGFISEIAYYSLVAYVYFPQQQSHLPAAGRTESLPDQRDGASNTADARVDSIVGKFLLWLPRDQEIAL